MNKTALAPFLKGRCTDGKKRITDIILYLFDKMYTCLIEVTVIHYANYLGIKISYKFG